jgi:hypothetical protein
MSSSSGRWYLKPRLTIRGWWGYGGLLPPRIPTTYMPPTYEKHCHLWLTRTTPYNHKTILLNNKRQH